jgi:hypothetical protein
MGQPSHASTDDHQVVFLSERHARSGPQGSPWQRFAVALVTV